MSIVEILSFTFVTALPIISLDLNGIVITKTEMAALGCHFVMFFCH